ncbi:MAG TPA: ABC transporter permease [Candidatus Eisenbacteria bacterium]|nr:ABC transporter permease [Candidatus Eisenbacteria bacterium]
MSTLVQDLAYGMRTLRARPTFTLLAVLMLALGIGANTAIFSVVNAVLLRPLPFKDSDRLVRVWHTPPAKSFPGIDKFSVSAANYIDWKRDNHVFDDMAIYSYRGLTLTGLAQPQQVDASSVSQGFFETLGVRPMLGRVFSPEEDQPGRTNVAVLTYRFWQEHFGSNPDIVGHDVTMDGQNFLIAGVMPPSFRFPEFAQIWTPMGWTDKERAVRGEHHSVVIARLKDGVGLQQAQAEMNTISRRLEELYPVDNKGWGAIVVPLQQDLASDVRPALLVLLGAVAFVLLIACANVANLALARTFSRQKEIAIRSALGASSARVLRQILTESVLLASIGGTLGLVVAYFGERFLVAYLGNQLPPTVTIELDLRVLAFAACTSILTGVAAGVLPAFRLAKSDINQALKQGLGRMDTSSASQRTRSVLVVAEVALSLVLLMGAGLMIRSLHQLQNVLPGFESRGVLTMTAAVARAKFPEPQQEIQFFDQVLQRVRVLPGVESAGVIDDIPLDNGGSHQPIQIEGQPVVAMADQPEVDVRAASAGYMRAMHIPIVRGRDFNDQDVVGRPAAVLISQSMAEHFWPGEDPIGKRLTLTFSPEHVREVVGVVGDVKLDGLDQQRPSTAIYEPIGQLSGSSKFDWRSFPMTFVVRSTVAPSSMVSAVTNAIHEVDRDMPVRDIFTMDDMVAKSLSQPRFNMFLLGIFAAIAALLAAIGIYSVLSYSVRQRVPEIGIRLALGARIEDVLRMVVFEGMKPALLGVGIGIVASLALGRVIASLVYQVKPSDPITFLAVAMLLGLIALIACVIPAYRASRVDPVIALRNE